jgi:hypothetical protein
VPFKFLLRKSGHEIRIRRETRAGLTPA